MTLIQFQQVTKKFRRHQVLQGIDLAIDRGERVALVGSNGAGKTTLIRCLLGEYNHGGTLLVNGREPRRHRTEVLGAVGFVPQISPPLKMPVAQLVRFAAGVCNSDPKRIEAVAGELGLALDEIGRRPFNRLSGGMKQKLLIAIALGRETELLVLDEPAANLDPEARHRFFELLAERKERAAMIISSHRLDEVASLVNRVVELDQGRIVLDDQVADDVALTSVLAARVSLVRPSDAFAKAIQPWGFASSDDGRSWEGRVAGPDRLRFLGVLSRYAALLKGIELRETNDD